MHQHISSRDFKCWSGTLSLFWMVLVLLAAGCGADFTSPSSAPPGDPKLLAGTWAGSIQLADSPGVGGGISGGISIVFNSAGQIVSINDSEGHYTGITGSVEGVSGDTKLFLITLDNGGGVLTEAGLYTDATFTHGGFLDQNFNVAVIEKGAPEPYVGGPAYLATALNTTGGPITSKFISIDATFTITPGGSSMVEVNSAAPPYLLGNDTEIGVFQSDDLILANSDFGLFTGTIKTTDSLNITAGAFTAMPTPDLSYAGSYACNNGFIVFGNCGFRVWSY